MPAPKKKASPKKSTPTSSRGEKGVTAARKSPRRREIGAFSCLLLGVFSFLAYFNATGWLIQGLRSVLSGLVGWGFFAVSPALFLSASILALHRGRPVAFRVTGTAMVPVLVGALLHLFLSSVNASFGSGLVGALWGTGQGMASGGVVSGLITIGLESMVSPVGAAIVLILVLAFLALVIGNKTITDIADWYRNREKLAYPPATERAYREVPQQEDSLPFDPAPSAATRRRSTLIDIPIDGESPTARKAVVQTEEVPQKAEKKGIKLRRPGVTPLDEFLVESEEKGTEAKPAEAPAKPTRSDFARRFDIQFSHDEHVPVVGHATDVPDLTKHQPIIPVPVPEVSLAPKIEKPPAAKAESKAVSQGTAVPKVTSAEPVPEPGIDKVKPQEVAAARVDIAKDIAERAGDEPLDYKYPSMDLLRQGTSGVSLDGKKEVALNAERLDAALESFGIVANIVNATRGPSVTRYELELEPGMKLSKLTNLAGDLALSLGASSVRIAPIPDKIATVGIEVPNKVVSMVCLRDVIESDNFQKPQGKLTFALGKDISGSSMVGNIAKLPHLLIAGTTGSGKSVTMNSLILSVLYKARPDEVKFIMIDPKMVEFGIFNGIPHLLIPVVTDPKKAAGALQWAVTEMLKRYNLFKDAGVRDLETYNRRAAQQDDMQTFPQLVVVIDELADLMIVASKEVEESICRVAQMGRAAGIHLVIATQRPSADVITGLMKANIPSRIALSVSSSMESRIIMDENGADKLVGNGDMLYKPVGGKPARIQGTYVSDEEREEVIEFLKSEGTPQYDDSVDNFIESAASDEKSTGAAEKNSGSDKDYDEMFEDAVNVVLDLGQASTSVLQRRLKLGYSRAARLIDQLEEAGIVGGFEGSKPRKLLISRAEWQAMQGGGAEEPAPTNAPATDAAAFAAIPKDDFSDLENEAAEGDSYD